MTDTNIISGAKGKKGGTSSAGNTMRSKTRAGVILAVSEGPVKGLVNGLKSVFFNKTPLQNADGSLNFKNVFTSFQNGHPDDTAFAGFNGTQTPISLNTPVKKNLGPITQTVVEPLADAVKVIMRVDSLFSVNDKGALRTASVSYKIDMRVGAGTYSEVLINNITNQKCTSPTQIEHLIDLPQTGTTWDIRVTRLTDDVAPENDKLQNGITFDSLIVIVNEKFTYPNTAKIAVEVNAEDIGSSMPDITVEIEGREILVPSNYNPVTRVYTGIWNGTFKVAYSNNPAWIYYDMAENDVFGIGDLINIQVVNKWALYEIAQICDGLVKSGYKDDFGVDIMEPRYTFNGVIKDKRAAFFALRAITTTWRGMSYWSYGQVFATIDAPQDTARIFGPANVLEGRFDYSDTSSKARHSVVLVRWNDPNDHFAPATEVYVDDELLKLYGWRDKQVSLEGCSSRSLARRYAKWVIDTEKSETETVTFAASWDNIGAMPGEIIEISDPRRALVFNSGRIKAHAATRIDLDTDFDPTVGQTYQIRVQKSDGTLITCPILQTYPAEPRRLRIASVNQLAPDANYIIVGSDVAPRTYRLLSIDETDNAMFNVTALQHDPTKYARVEQGINFEPVPYIRNQNIIGAPTNLVAQEVTYTSTGTPVTEVTLSWQAPIGVPVRSYVINAVTPTDGEILLDTVSGNTLTYLPEEAGTYIFSVKAISFSGVISAPTSLTYVVTGAEGLEGGLVTDLVNVATGLGGTTTFSGRDISISWKSKFTGSTNAAATNAPASENNADLYSHNTVEVYAGATLLRSQRVVGELYVYSYDLHAADALTASLASPARALTFKVSVSDKLGRTSAKATLNLNNPVPAMFNPTVSSVGTTINIQWTPPADADLEGVLVWIETETGFDPAVKGPKFDGSGSFFSFIGLPSQSYVVRAAGYDGFGRTGLLICPEISISTGLDLGDIVPPPVVTGLALTSALVGSDARLSATWSVSAAADILGYEVEIKQASGNFVAFTTGLANHEWDVLAGVSYTVRVRAVDRSGNRSAYCAEVSHTAIKDTTAPAVPTGLSATGSFESVWLKMNRNAEADLAFYEIYESATTTAPLVGTAASFTSSSETMVRSGLTGAIVTKNYWVRSADTSGNKSAWSAMVSATTVSVDATITTAALAGLVDSSSFAAGIEAIEVLAALPATGNFIGRQVFLTTDKKLYRHTGTPTNATGFTASVAGADIVAGSITAGQIAAGAIGAEQIAAKAIRTENLLITGNGPALNQDPNILDDAVWSYGATPVIATIADGKTGTRVLRGVTGADATYFSKEFPAVAGRKYRIRMWQRSSISSGSGMDIFRLKWLDANGVDIGNAGGVLVDFSTTWREVVYNDLTAPVGAASAKFYIALAYGYSVGFSEAQGITCDEMIVEASIVGGAITARTVGANEIIANTANIKNGIITDAKITTLSAAKLVAGTALAGSITISGTALSEIATNAQDPATRVNAGVTQIDPGKIVISGTTTLADWRSGSDTTKIEGGNIAANTISANKLTIGGRNVTVSGVAFEHNSPTFNYVSWTDGIIQYVNDAGTAVSATITANATGTLWTSGVIYVYWVKGGTSLLTTTNIATAFDTNNLVLASYQGGSKLTAEYGKTVIDGDLIKTGGIFADNIVAGAVTSDKMDVVWLNAERISASYLDVDGLLSILTGAGLKYQKASVSDDGTDGIYFGVDGSNRFGFAASRTAAGKRQSFKISSDTGLQFFNARHFVSGNTLPTPVTVTSNLAKTALPAGTKSVQVQLSGGGASGWAYSYYDYANNAGAATTVKIWDGATLKHTFTAAGAPTGRGGPSGIYAGPGDNNFFGASGGQGGTVTSYRDAVGYTTSNQQGGKAGAYTSSETIDVSSYASPMIEVTLGNGGASSYFPPPYGPNVTSTTPSGAGVKGKAIYNYSTAQDIQADVVPLRPTATGSFSNPGSGGVVSFPNLGAGFWEIWSSLASLNMNYISQSDGSSITGYPNYVSFFSSRTPLYQPITGACTIGYVFHSMGNWG